MSKVEPEESGRELHNQQCPVGPANHFFSRAIFERLYINRHPKPSKKTSEVSEVVDRIGAGRGDEDEGEAEDSGAYETAFHLLAHVVQAAPVENEVSNQKSNHSIKRSRSSRSHLRPVIALRAHCQRKNIASNSTEQINKQRSGRSERMLDSGQQNESGKHVTHYVNEVHMQKNSTHQPVNLPRGHTGTVISTQTTQSTLLHLQKRTLLVEPQRNLSDEEGQVGQNDEYGHRAARKSGTEGADKHIPVILLSRVLDLPASRDEQDALLFSVSHLLLSDKRTKAIPGGSILLNVLMRVALRLHASGRVWSPVSQRMNVHYSQFLYTNPPASEKL